MRQCAFPQIFIIMFAELSENTSPRMPPMWSLPCPGVLSGAALRTPALQTDREEPLLSKPPPSPRQIIPELAHGPSPQHARQRHMSTQTPFPPSPPTRSPPSRGSPEAATPTSSFRHPSAPAPSLAIFVYLILLICQPIKLFCWRWKPYLTR